MAPLLATDTKPTTFAVMFLLFLLPCMSEDPTGNHGHIVSTQAHLFAACSMCPLHVVEVE